MKIGVIGNGKMGQKIQEIIGNYGHEAVLLETSLRRAATVAFPEKVEALLDFSHPNNLEKILSYSIQHQLPIVIGTTGYSETQLQTIQKAGQTIPILYGTNFSLGILVMNKLVKQVAKTLENWEIELIEKHHDQKKDAPSGTAKTLIASLQEARNLTPVFQWEDQPRTTDKIGVHSIRAGSIPGEHEVLFATTNEVLSIKHESFSNQIFADGAIKAILWLKDQSVGFYHLEDMMNI